jgi:tRNA1Val (adenine37-N6)-methyltransferase
MSVFQFKHFSVQQADYAHPVGTDSLVLGALLKSEVLVQHILDIGTGTGVLALMSAQQFPDAEIVGIEPDEQSHLLAQLNFSKSPWSDRLTATLSNLEQFNHTMTFDLIVSNPPYYGEAYLSPDQNRNRQRNSKHLPLSDLIEKAKHLLSLDGSFWFIVPHRRKHEIEELIQTNDLFLQRAILVCGKPDVPSRMIYCIGLRVTNSIIHEDLTIRNNNGAYTEEYKQLTKEFHNRVL